jgi:hypothetical protein
VWERRARSGDSSASPQRGGAAVAPGRRPLTGALPGAAESGWPAWNEGGARDQGQAGQGSFLGDALGARLRFPWGAEMPLEREAMRREVERHWAGGGRVRAQTWLLHFEVLSRTPEGAPVRTDGAPVAPGEIDAALAVAREEIDAVSAEEKAYQQRFVGAARALTGEMLAGSEAVVRGSLAGYGIELGPVLEKAIEKEGRTAEEIGLDVLDNPLEPLGQAMVASSPALHAGAERETASRAELARAAQDLRTRAAELAEANAENDRLQVEVERRRGGVCHTSHRGAGGPEFSHVAAFPVPEITFQGRRIPVADEPALDVQATGSARRVVRLTTELRDAWRGHEAKHPVLAAYRDAGGSPTEELGRLTGGRDERHRELVRVSFERLCAIAKARQAVTSGAVSVLELPRVVERTRTRLGVEPGSVEDAFIGNAVADASDPDWLVWVVSALSFASAILLAPATAGSSAALAFDLGFLTADIWFAIEAAAEHTFATAAANTDYDPENALAEEEPSVASTLLGLVATTLGGTALGQTLTSARRISTAAHAADSTDVARRGTGRPSPDIDEDADCSLDRASPRIIDTPYGRAVQSDTAEAAAARRAVERGAPIYRQGNFGIQYTLEGQFWALRNPVHVAGYASKMGMPAGSEQPDWVMGAIGPKDGKVITRPAPALGANAGGDLEAVVEPGSTRALWFHMPEYEETK